MSFSFIYVIHVYSFYYPSVNAIMFADVDLLCLLILIFFSFSHYGAGNLKSVNKVHFVACI